MRKLAAHDLIAFGIIEYNTPLPLKTLYEMTTDDPLYKALMRAWRNKERRADYRVGLICAVLANCMGSGKKKYEPTDFMPKEFVSVEEREAEIKANFKVYQNAK